MRVKGDGDESAAGLHNTHVVLVVVHCLLVDGFHFGSFTDRDVVACCYDVFFIRPWVVGVLDNVFHIGHLGAVCVSFDERDEVAVFGSLLKHG